MDPRFIQQLECVPDTEGGEAAFVVLEQKVEKGAKRRFGCIGESEKNRLAHEFELIHATNTTKLFLYWADIVAAIRQKIQAVETEGKKREIKIDYENLEEKYSGYN